jgi:hypothetical protein
MFKSTRKKKRSALAAETPIVFAQDVQESDLLASCHYLNTIASEPTKPKNANRNLKKPSCSLTGLPQFKPGTKPKFANRNLILGFSCTSLMQIKMPESIRPRGGTISKGKKSNKKRSGVHMAICLPFDGFLRK